MFKTDPLLIVWQRKWVVLAATIIGVLLAIAYLNVAQYEYRAELRVTSADSSRTPTLANVAQTLTLSPASALGLGGESSATPFDI